MRYKVNKSLLAQGKGENINEVVQDIVSLTTCFKAFGGTSPNPTKDIALVNVENF